MSVSVRLAELHWPGSTIPSLLAALTTWVTLLAWTGFAEHPSGYLVPLFGGCLLVAVLGMLLRSARVPAVLVLLVQLVVVGLWLDHLWAAGPALGGWIPTPDSIRAALDTIGDGVRAAQAYAAPVPKTVPHFDAVMVLVGMGAALVVDFLACGVRRAPLAGLPLLAAYTAPVSILDGGVSWVKFVLAATCFFFLIAANEAQRLAHWGHQLSGSRLFDTQVTKVSTQAVWSSARKIGFTATGLAVVIPLLIPTFSGSLFGGHGNGPGGNGDNVTISNPMVDMKRDLTQGADLNLVDVHTKADPSYLRLTVLDSFDGTAWRPSGRDIPVENRAEGLIASPPGLDANLPTHTVVYQIQDTSHFESRWLATPYPVYSIHAPGDWRYDENTLDFISAANGQTAAGLGYRLQALEIDFTATDLEAAGPAPASISDPATKLPKDIPASVHALARRVTKGAETQFDEAVRLQRFFRVDGGFTYSLQHAAGDGMDALVHFLGTGPGSRTGYCQQFATAMALMGRSLGIPSRVAVGFLHPQQVGPDNYVFSTHDLHAWPEMYFDGIGWVRFEPTPQSRSGSVPPYTRHVNKAQPTAPTSSAAALPSNNRFLQPSTGPDAGGSAGSGGGPSVRGLGIAVLVVLVLALLTTGPRLARVLVRRRRWSAATGSRARAEAAWAELRDTATDLGIAWDDSVTLRTRARDLARSFGAPDGTQDAISRSAHRGPRADPEATAALDRLVRRLERARYARTPPEDTADLVNGPDIAGRGASPTQVDVGLCAQALRAGSSRRMCLRATWLPASVWSGVLGAHRARRGTDARFAAPAGVDHAL
ncbi:MAG TPA: DUF3488 and transglutaminase-like domain-containing protein [Nocardioidaceae bacterium]|nr:DUF3488 and transglutaminase-like domain-containing protein [Nocardioidaceae bacterium]